MRLVRLTVFMGILLLVLSGHSPVSAQETRQGWLDEVLNVHNHCLVGDLFTGECFNRVYKDMGFPPPLSGWMADNKKEVGTSYYAVCAIFFWDSKYVKYVTCQKLLINAGKDDGARIRLRQYLLQEPSSGVFIK